MNALEFTFEQRKARLDAFMKDLLETAYVGTPPLALVEATVDAAVDVGRAETRMNAVILLERSLPGRCPKCGRTQGLRKVSVSYVQHDRSAIASCPNCYHKVLP